MRSIQSSLNKKQILTYLNSLTQQVTLEIYQRTSIDTLFCVWIHWRNFVWDTIIRLLLGLVLVPISLAFMFIKAAISLTPIGCLGCCNSECKNFKSASFHVVHRIGDLQLNVESYIFWTLYRTFMALRNKMILYLRVIITY